RRLRIGHGAAPELMLDRARLDAGLPARPLDPAQPLQVPPGRALAGAIGVVAVPGPLFRRPVGAAHVAGPHRGPVRDAVVVVGRVGRIAPVARIAVADAQRDARRVAVIGIAVPVVVVLGDRRSTVVATAIGTAAHVVVGGASGQREGTRHSGQRPQFHGSPLFRYDRSFGAAL